MNNQTANINILTYLLIFMIAILFILLTIYLDWKSRNKTK